MSLLSWVSYLYADGRHVFGDSFYFLYPPSAAMVYDLPVTHMRSGAACARSSWSTTAALPSRGSLAVPSLAHPFHRR